MACKPAACRLLHEESALSRWSGWHKTLVCLLCLQACPLAASREEDEALFAPVFTTRLHRYDHEGLQAMLEEDARWQRNGTKEASGEHQYVNVSAFQADQLRQHHESQRSQVQLDMKLEVRGKHGKLKGGTTGGMTYHAAADDVIRESNPAVIRMRTVASQYVGPIEVGTIIKSCDQKPAGRRSSLLQRGTKFASFSDSTGRLHHCQYTSQSTTWVVFDTGSTNVWVVSDLCGSPACQKHVGKSRVYNHSMSQTYKEPESGDYLSIVFGTGRISGPQAVDDMHVGPFTVRGQVFGMIEKEDGKVFDDVPFEGIMGLAFPSMSAAGVPSLLDNIIEQKVLERNIFALYFSADEPTANAMFWGGVDRRFFDGSLDFFPVVDEHYWAIQLVCFSIGDQEILSDRAFERTFLDSAATARRRPKAVLDSGTTYFTVETPLYDKVVEALPVMLCSQLTEDTHPDVTLTLLDEDGQPRDFVLNRNEYMVRTPDGKCWPAFMKIDLPRAHGPGMVFGDVFLRAFVSVYDRGNGRPGVSRVGLARARRGDEISDYVRELTKTQPSFNEHRGRKTRWASLSRARTGI